MTHICPAESDTGFNGLNGCSSVTLAGVLTLPVWYPICREPSTTARMEVTSVVLWNRSNCQIQSDRHLLQTP